LWTLSSLTTTALLPSISTEIDTQMKKGLLVLASLALAACSDVAPTAPTDVNGPSYAVSAAPGQNKLQCFSGSADGDQGGVTYGGTCRLLSSGAKGTAVLDNSDGDTDGSYSGVYVENSNLNGKRLSEIAQLSFQYTGTATAGSPRFSLPLSGGGYAFISAYYCNNGAGLVDAISDPTCTIYYNGASYENWAAFVAANSALTVTSATPFVIADDAGSWTVSNVKLGKAGK
jgi:hypothetical protein